jgi:hypothetical protein
VVSPQRCSTPPNKSALRSASPFLAGLVAQASQALTHGYATALVVAASMLLVAALVVTIAVNTPRTQRSDAGQTHAAVPTGARDEIPAGTPR